MPPINVLEEHEKLAQFLVAKVNEAAESAAARLEPLGEIDTGVLITTWLGSVRLYGRLDQGADKCES
jgi:hypothetical protein